VQPETVPVPVGAGAEAVAWADEPPDEAADVAADVAAEVATDVAADDFCVDFCDEVLWVVAALLAVDFAEVDVDVVFLLVTADVAFLEAAEPGLEESTFLFVAAVEVLPVDAAGLLATWLDDL